MINEVVQVTLDVLVGGGLERGLQVAAYLDGELVFDAWSGVADASTGRPVDGESLFVAFSCGKGVLATAVHLLAERGQLPVGAWSATRRHSSTGSSGTGRKRSNRLRTDGVVVSN